MAIVVPVAMHAMQISSRAGLSGARRDTAARIAERVMNELVATGENLLSSRSGRIIEGDAEFEWTLRSRSWSEDDLDLITVAVAYEIQGRESVVRLSTLYDSSTQIALTIE